MRHGLIVFVGAEIGNDNVTFRITQKELFGEAAFGDLAEFADCVPLITGMAEPGRLPLSIPHQAIQEPKGYSNIGVESRLDLRQSVAWKIEPTELIPEVCVVSNRNAQHGKDETCRPVSSPQICTERRIGTTSSSRQSSGIAPPRPRQTLPLRSAGRRCQG